MIGFLQYPAIRRPGWRTPASPAPYALATGQRTGVSVRLEAKRLAQTPALLVDRLLGHLALQRMVGLAVPESLSPEIGAAAQPLLMGLPLMKPQAVTIVASTGVLLQECWCW